MAWLRGSDADQHFGGDGASSSGDESAQRRKSPGEAEADAAPRELRRRVTGAPGLLFAEGAGAGGAVACPFAFA
ncbi:unnamed protein product, partial [Amoebophrya sp. A120]|eukprot:GSA120T00022313001.1